MNNHDQQPRDPNNREAVLYYHQVHQVNGATSHVYAERAEIGADGDLVLLIGDSPVYWLPGGFWLSVNVGTEFDRRKDCPSDFFDNWGPAPIAKIEGGIVVAAVSSH